jgi:hypothetical protein
MSVIDILTRVDAICNKYNKYDVEKQKDLNVSGDDAFARLYAAVDADIEAALQVSSISLKSDGFVSCFKISVCLLIWTPVKSIYRLGVLVFVDWKVS